MNTFKKYIFIAFLYFSILSLSAQEAEFIWAFQGGHTSFTEGNMQIVNTEQGIIAAGDFLEEATFGTYEIESIGASDIYIAKMDEDGEVIQLESFGSPNEEFLRFLDVDQQGNIFMSIIFTDFINFNGVEYISNGGQDILLIKYNADLEVQWTKHFGNEQTDYLRGMTIDQEGDIVIFGKFKNTLEFDDIALTSSGSTDLFIAKINNDGDIEFAISEGGNGYEEANNITSDHNNNYFISGVFYSETILNGEVIETENETGLYIAKYNQEGSFQWVEIIDGDQLSASAEISTDGSGNIVIAGSFEGNITFGEYSFTTPEFDADIYIGKYNTDGDAIWGGHGESNTSDFISSLACDQDDNIFISGKYLSDISFDGLILNYTLC